MRRAPLHGAALALLCCLPLAPVWAKAPAVLKLQVQIDAPVIKVGDLWGNAGAQAATVIGPAPPPGRTIAIEAGQLAYIAHLYDVDWQPISGVERSSLERAGRPLSRDELAEPIRRSLIDAGAARNASVEFADFAPVEVPPMSFPQIEVTALAYDAGGERFTAEVVASGDGMPQERMRLSGRVLQMVPAVVATRRLQPGELIAAGDVQVVQVAQRRLSGPVASEVSQVVGQASKRAIVAGQPVAVADIGPPMLVAKGDTVVIVVETPGMYMAAQGIAMSAGGRDDVIQVMNPLSRAIVAARVTGPGKATIAPGAQPLTPPVRPAADEVAN
jgi:flagella basal body P-ring formation protein FlgA